MEKVVKYTKSKFQGRGLELTESEVTDLDMLLFTRQIGRRLGEATLDRLAKVKGPATVQSLGDNYSGQIGVFCADLYNGKQKAHYFFSAMYEIMKREKAKQTLH